MMDQTSTLLAVALLSLLFSDVITGFLAGNTACCAMCCESCAGLKGADFTSGVEGPCNMLETSSLLRLRFVSCSASRLCDLPSSLLCDVFCLFFSDHVGLLAVPRHVVCRVIILRAGEISRWRAFLRCTCCGSVAA